jgi:tRNA pseudouridine38-40 synthase
MNNVLLKIAYDGSKFHGWQRQPGLRTVQGDLDEVFYKILGVPVSLEGTSRTDAGVHALGQYATLRGDFGIPVSKIPVAANNLLNDAEILSACEKPEGFHARFSAKGKTYFYRFAVSPKITVFLHDYVYLLAKRPNIDNMVEAAKYVEGTHDFACFQAAGGTPRETTVRTIFNISLEAVSRTDPAGNEYEAVEVSVKGDGFLYNMVRIIAGTLLDVGFLKIKPEEISEIIASKDRSRAGPTAPPGGLYLKEVYFEKCD